MQPATVAIVIATPAGFRHLACTSERDAAGPAEAILRGLGADVRSASFWVSCAQSDAAARLTTYLRAVQTEIIAELTALPLSRF